MKCKAFATQEARHINEIGEPPSSAPQSNSPVQTVLQRSLKMRKLFFCLVWVLIAAMLYAVFDELQQPNTLSSLGDKTTVILKRGLDGHYRSEALINGLSFNVLVDTGATGVIIPQAVADQLGIQSAVAVRTNTANGESTGYLVRLQSIKLGGIVAQDVSAIIAPSLSGDVLLGMSFLGRMDVRLFNNEMQIKQTN